MTTHKGEKHTALPWSMEYVKDGGYDCMGPGWHLKDPKGDMFDTIETSKANAQFIVRACNHHHKLIEALEGLMDEITNEIGCKEYDELSNLIAQAKGE